MTDAPQWPADSVERRPLAALIPHARNARTHSDAQINQIAASIREWGWTMPVLVDEGGTIIAGHGRVMAAARLGIGEAPVMVARGWSEPQKRAYMIADNKLSLNAGWDSELLGLEIADIGSFGFDLSLMGFSKDELTRLSTSAGLTDPDSVPAPPAVPVSRRGDVWTLGRHRLVCGDATDADDAALALDGAAPNLMVTDPPYGVNYDPSWREGIDAGYGKRATGKVENDDRVDWTDAWAHFHGGVAYVWFSSQYASTVQQSLEAHRFAIRNVIIWVKQHFVLSRGDYHWQHEPCWYAIRDGHRSDWTGDRKQSTVWEIKNNNSFGNAGKEQVFGHGTQKPIECMRRPIENNSHADDAIYDPFVGTGTTIIAAEMMGRACRAIEINPLYVDVAVARWEAFTGNAASRETQGEVNGTTRPPAAADRAQIVTRQPRQARATEKRDPAGDV